MEDCVFCKIIKKEIPSKIVYEDSSTIVFKDINPKAPVHLLAVPREHIEPAEEGFNSADSDILGALFHAAEEAAEKSDLKERGYRLIVNIGPESGQEVAHLHMHILGGRPLGPMVQEV